MRRTIIVALLIVAVVGGLALAMKKHAPKAPPPTTEEIWKSKGVPVETAAIIRGDMEETIEVTGDIETLNSVALSAKIAGRVAAVYVREGDRVSVGQTVATLDQDDALSNLKSAEGGLESALARLSQAKTNAKVTKIQTDAAIEQAQAALSQVVARLAVTKNPARSQEMTVSENRVAAAKANLENKEADYKRYKQLLDKGAVSESTFDVQKTQYTIAQTEYKSAVEQLSMIREGGRSEDVTASQASVDVAKEQLRTAKANASQNLLREEDVKSAQAAVSQAKAAVALARQQLSYTYIKSPISGEVASRTTEPGQVVSPGQPLVNVVNLGSVYFKGDVSEKEVVNVAKRQSVRVRVDAIPGTEFQGVVAEVYPAGSSLSRNFPVRIDIAGGGRLIKPAMFARGEIITGTSRDTLLVPKDAVEERRGTTMLFTLESDGVVKRHDVRVVRENSHFVQVAGAETLKEGDKVVTKGRQNVQDGSTVSVKK